MHVMTPVLTHEPLSKYTFTKTGGPADFLALPESVAEVQELVKEAKAYHLPLTIIGNASNLIIRDGGIAGLVLILTKMNQVEVHQTTITAQAGARIIEVAQAALTASLSGLEFAAGIPGSVGGAVFMNAGAYGGEVSTVISAVTVLDEVGRIRRLTPPQLDFNYRHSVIQTRPWTVLAADFSLTWDVHQTIAQRMLTYNTARANKQPLSLPSCGSVFKRPPHHYTGPLIQQAGLQGYQIGGAQVSTKHAGFIVNVDHATATDYLNLIHTIQERVWANSQVKLEPEVRIIGRS